MKILYVGPLNADGTCLARGRGLQELGHELSWLDTLPHVQHRARILRVLHNRLQLGPGVSSLNRELLLRARRERPDIVWIDKGVHVRARTLEAIRTDPGAFLVHHTTDDLRNARHGFRHYLGSLDLYDAHFVSIRPNLGELRALTSRPVLHNEMGYDDHRFGRYRPSPREAEEGAGDDLFFIGHWEPRTEELCSALVAAALPLRVRGPGWAAAARRLPPGVASDEFVGGQEYVRALTLGKIGLGFLSSWNRNDTTPRVFEIPACSTMLLAPRTEALSALYEEGTEAEFFSGPEELVEKARYYLEHDEERQAMAAAGRARLEANRTTWRDRMREAIEELERAGRLERRAEPA